MTTCKNPKCNKTLGRYATHSDGLCRDCRGPKGAAWRAAQKQRAKPPSKVCACGAEISPYSKKKKCKACAPLQTFLCVNPYCETRVYSKWSFCRPCFMVTKDASIKAQHAGFCLSLKEKS